MKKIEITDKTITLGQFLKFSGVAETGGMAKRMLVDLKIEVNDVRELKRGRKLTKGDVVKIEQFGTYKIV
ncbi:MAG: RNA-binding S4 domain-containing protein [Candidatus Izimaplasma sp.]|nr:RNA-binding S4 domain-containing protein [Candidatus Izimaplasma bacterium]